MKHRRSAPIFRARYFPVAAFVVFTVGGAAFIAVSKTAGINPFVSMAVPIVLMFAYLGLSAFANGLRVHDEQAGDNLYYMGFLFTLTSLGVSLYKFGTGSSTDEIVRNFGIAVTSTITGIALRIFYNQVRRDPADVERATRHELADMTRRVRAEMENVAREFSEYRRVSNQMLQEGFGEIAEQAELNGKKMRESMNEMGTKAMEPMVEASGRLSEALDTSAQDLVSNVKTLSSTVKEQTDSLGTYGKDVSKSLQGLSGKLDKMAKRIESVRVPEQVMREELPPMLGQLSETLSSHAAAVAVEAERQASEHETTREAVRSTVASAERAAAAMENFDGKAERLFDLVVKQNEGIADLLATIRENAATAVQAADGRSSPASETAGATIPDDRSGGYPAQRGAPDHGQQGSLGRFFSR